LRMAQSAAFSSERLFFKYDLIFFIIHMNILIHKLTALLTSVSLLSENSLEVVSMYLKLDCQYLYYFLFFFSNMPQYVYFFIQVIKFSCHNASFLIVCHLNPQVIHIQPRQPLQFQGFILSFVGIYHKLECLAKSSKSFTSAMKFSC